MCESRRVKPEDKAWRKAGLALALLFTHRPNRSAPHANRLATLSENLLLSGIDLVRMHAVPLRRFRNRRILAQRLERGSSP